MNQKIFLKLLASFLFISSNIIFSSEENFILINGLTNETVLEIGSQINERVPPACSFNILLSLAGYEEEVLIDDQTPRWNYEDGYDDYLESWKAPQTPLSWMNCSCVWYSKLLAEELNNEVIQIYLFLFSYGNQNISSGLTPPGPQSPPWVKGSLKISPKEQVTFINNLLQGKLLVEPSSIKKTKVLLFKEELKGGWKLFGKSGLTSIYDIDGNLLQLGWFVGWIEKDKVFYPFAYNIRDTKIPGQRIPRVKQLLESITR